MPAFTKISVGSFCGISEPDGTTSWPRLPKYERKVSRICFELFMENSGEWLSTLAGAAAPLAQPVGGKTEITGRREDGRPDEGKRLASKPKFSGLPPSRFL